MTTYGITEAGFFKRPRSVTRSLIAETIKTIPSLAESDTDDVATFEGGLTEMMTEHIDELYQLAALAYHSGFSVTATGTSFDKALLNIFQSRIPEKHSTAPLRLYNRTESSPVPVPAESLCRQSVTSVLWETSEDAEIPALSTLVDDDVAAIIWQPGNSNMRLTFVSADLSAVAVAVGDEITISGSVNSENNGTFTLTTADFAYVEYSNPNISSSAQDEVSSTATAFIEDVETSVDVAARSRNPGPFEATAGSIDTVVTGIAGFDGVSNTADAEVGRYLESPAEARSRINARLAVAQGATVNAIIDNVGRVDGVTYGSVIVNRLGYTDNGLPANSYKIIVTGGNHQDIIDAIGASVAAGLQTVGDIPGTYYDTNGNPHTVNYSRATELNPYFVVTMTRTAAGFPTDAADQIRAAMNALNFDRGQDVYNYAFTTAVGALLSGVDPALPGVTGFTITQGYGASPATADVLTVGADEVLNVIEDRIAVSFVDA